MTRVLLKLPGVTYEKGMINYEGLYKYINEFANQVLTEFKQLSSHNQYKQFDYLLK